MLLCLKTPPPFQHRVDLGEVHHQYRRKLYYILARTLFELIARHLDVDVSQVEDVLNGFSYDPFEAPVFGFGQEPYVHPCENVTIGSGRGAKKPSRICDIAASELTNPDEVVGLDRCRWYCHNLVEDDQLKRRAGELFDLATHVTGGFRPDYPHQLLPQCQHPALQEAALLPRQCWRRIVNEFGICYSTQTGTVESR